MNKLTIIGNLTGDPETRTTSTGKDVCTFTVAVNRRKKSDGADPGADFFRVSAWNELGKICQQYLSKGKKVAVIGPVSVHAFTRQDGKAGASLEVTAQDMEILSPKGDGFTPVNDPDDPFGR